MNTITLPSGRSFPAENGLTLLAAAEATGVVLPYSCRTGRCSSCRMKLVSGKTRAQVEEVGLSATERAAGYILGCVREAESDVEVEVEDFTGLDLPAKRTLPCRLDSVEDLSANVRRIVLRLPPTAGFRFLPGQYVDVIGPRGVRRSYSLASAASDRLTLHIERVEHGVMSDYIFTAAQPNDLLRLHGPLGTFVLRDIAGRDLAFLATGTGIAPVLAMLEQLATLVAAERPRSVHVIWGGRTRSDLYLDVAALHGAINYVPTLSREGPDWHGERAYVQDALLALGLDLATAKVYACGGSAMVYSARDRLVAAGLPSANFYSDAFVSSSPTDI